MSQSPGLFLADIDLSAGSNGLYILIIVRSIVSVLLPAKALGCGNLKDNIGLC